MGEFVATLTRQNRDNEYDDGDAGTFESCYAETVALSGFILEKITSELRNR